MSSTPEPTYELIRQAILEKKQVLADYNGYPREMCPHVLGTHKGEAQCLFYQFAGSSSTGSSFPPGSKDNWRCMELPKLQNVRLREGEWHTAEEPRQNCVDVVDLVVADFQLTS